jgi:hypothetical protein
MKNGAKLLFVSLLIPMFAYSADDLYFSPKDIKKEEAKPSVQQTDVQSSDSSVSYSTSSENELSTYRDVDEYNRRGTASDDNMTYEGVSPDMYIQMQEGSNSSVSDMGMEDDFEYTRRLAKFHETNIYVNDASVIVDNNTGDVYINGYDVSPNYVYSYDYLYPAYSSYYYWNRPYYGWNVGYSSYWGWNYGWGYYPSYYWGGVYYPSYPIYNYPSYYHPHYNYNYTGAGNAGRSSGRTVSSSRTGASSSTYDGRTSGAVSTSRGGTAVTPSSRTSNTTTRVQQSSTGRTINNSGVRTSTGRTSTTPTSRDSYGVQRDTRVNSSTTTRSTQAVPANSNNRVTRQAPATTRGYSTPSNDNVRSSNSPSPSRSSYQSSPSRNSSTPASRGVSSSPSRSSGGGGRR